MRVILKRSIGNWLENIRTWAEGDSEDGPTQAPGTKMKDVKFTLTFPTGQRNLVYTHALPARLCAHADDKNNNAVQRAVHDELRHVPRLHAVEFEKTLNSVACETCRFPGKHIIQMPLPVLDMPVFHCWCDSHACLRETQMRDCDSRVIDRHNVRDEG